MTTAEAVSAVRIIGKAAATGKVAREKWLTEPGVEPIPDSVLWLDSVRESAIRAFNPKHIKRRREIAGEPIWRSPIRHKQLLSADIEKGQVFERAQKIAGGVRLSTYENTRYGKLHEAARQGDAPHDWNHERRLFDDSEAILTQPEVTLHNADLYSIPPLWITTHDASQSIREYNGIKETKWGHDYLALLQALTQKDRVMKEAGISEDRARLITGANAVLMLYHDEPSIQSRILDAIEREDSLMPYREVEDRNGNTVRIYHTAQQLIDNLNDPKSKKVDLTAVPNWLMAQAVKLRLSQKGFGDESDPFSFGFDPVFEEDFRDELKQLATVPDGEGVTYDDEGHLILYTPEQIAAADERALIPRRLLDQQTRIDIALLGDIMRTVDVFDMIPPIAIMRKLDIPMNWERPIYRPETFESVMSGKGTLPADEDSMGRRTLFELHAAIMQIQRRPDQLRQPLNSIRYVRDTAHELYELGVKAYMRTMPILMSGDKPKIKTELKRILMDEHKKMARKIRRSRGINSTEKQQRIDEHLVGIEEQVNRIMDNMDTQFSRTYETHEIEDVLQTGQRFLDLANELYESQYTDRRTRPGRPYSTWESTSGGDVSRIRAMRRYASHNPQPIPNAAWYNKV